MKMIPEYVDLGLPSGTLWATKNVGPATQKTMVTTLPGVKLFPKKDMEESHTNG